MRGGENGLLLGALSRVSTEAKQPPKPSHKQSCPPVAAREIADADQDVVDPTVVSQPLLKVGNPKAAIEWKMISVVKESRGASYQTIIKIKSKEMPNKTLYLLENHVLCS